MNKQLTGFCWVRRRSRGSEAVEVPGCSHYYLPVRVQQYRTASMQIAVIVCFSTAILQAAQGIVLKFVTIGSSSLLKSGYRPQRIVNSLAFFYVGEWLGMGIYYSLRRYASIYLITCALTALLIVSEFVAMQAPGRIFICVHFCFFVSGILYTHFGYVSETVVVVFTHPNMHHLAYSFMCAFRLVVELLMEFIFQVIRDRGNIITTQNVIRISFFALMVCVALSYLLIIPVLRSFNIGFTGIGAFERFDSRRAEKHAGRRFFVGLMRYAMRINGLQLLYILAASTASAVSYNNASVYYYLSIRGPMTWGQKMILTTCKLLGIVLTFSSSCFIRERLVLAALVSFECVVVNAAIVFMGNKSSTYALSCVYSLMYPGLWYSLQRGHCRFIQARFLHISQNVVYVCGGMLALAFQAFQFKALQLDFFNVYIRVFISLSLPYAMIWTCAQVLIICLRAKA